MTSNNRNLFLAILKNSSEGLCLNKLNTSCILFTLSNFKASYASFKLNAEIHSILSYLVDKVRIIS